jgi:hypothetical protein
MAAAAVAASAVVSAVQPLVVNLIEPVGHDPAWLHYIQILGAPGVAIVAALIAWNIQRQQVRIQAQMATTARNKLKFDLFEKRLAIFDAGLALITDGYLSDDDPNPDGDFNRMLALISKTSGSLWLTDDSVQTFLTKVAADAHARYQDMMHRQERQQQTWKELGWHVTDEMKADRARQSRQQAELIGLFNRFLMIEH